MGTVKTNDPFYVNRPREYSPAGGNCFYKSVLSEFKSNVRETWRVILVSEADIFLSESLRNLSTEYQHH